MVFPIVGGNESKDTQQNSLRFNDGDSAYVSRTQTAGNRRTWTWSGWIKRGVISTRQTILSAGIDGSNESFLRFDASDYISIKESTGNSPEFAFDTTPVFRDASAWYHIVFVVDTTQGTDSNRVKLYVNGSQITSFSSTNYPSQNYDTRWNNNSQVTYLGMNVPDYRDYYDGYMADVHFIDGTAKAPTDFGETNSNGVWIPKDYDGSYGTNGYRLEFQQTGTSQNATGIGADTSGQGNHLAVSNLAATDVTTDSPTNNYATMSTIHPSASNFTISEGNLKISKSGTGTVGLYGQTLMATSGKWYFEVKIVTRGSSDRTRVGLANYESVTGTGTIQDNYSGVEISTASDDKIFTVVDGSTTENTTFYTALSDNDIVRFAVDMDNGRLYIGLNGNWWNYSSSQTGGDPTSGSGYVTNNTTIFNGSPMTAYSAHSAGLSTSSVQEFNFGNPTFAISSGNSDANGYGNFEYAVPSGYYAYNTKNLAEFG